MKTHIAWPISFAVVVAVLIAYIVNQKSWGPYYAEAEPLYPTVSEFGNELTKLRKSGVIQANDIESLIKQERFELIQPYGLIFSDDPKTIVSIRINEVFTFAISEDGQPLWVKN